MKVSVLWLLQDKVIWLKGVSPAVLSYLFPNNWSLSLVAARKFCVSIPMQWLRFSLWPVNKQSSIFSPTVLISSSAYRFSSLSWFSTTFLLAGLLERLFPVVWLCRCCKSSRSRKIMYFNTASFINSDQLLSTTYFPMLWQGLYPLWSKKTHLDLFLKFDIFTFSCTFVQKQFLSKNLASFETGVVKNKNANIKVLNEIVSNVLQTTFIRQRKPMKEAQT